MAGLNRVSCFILLASLLFGSCNATHEKNSGYLTGRVFSSEALGWQFEVPVGWEIVDLFDVNKPEDADPQPEGVLRAIAFHTPGRTNQCYLRVYDFSAAPSEGWKAFIQKENGRFLQNLLDQNYPASAATTTYPVKNVPFTLFEVYPPSFGMPGGKPGFAILNAWIDDYRLEIGMKLSSIDARNILLDQLERSEFSIPGKE